MNITSDVQSGNRIVFMDRLRLIMVLIVVLMHSAAAYTNIISWWSVQETPKSVALDTFALFVDGFQMPFLYFIAGYFTWFSLKKRTRRDFIISKFRRIGLPFVAIALFLTPMISYIGIKRVVPSAPGFFHTWLIQMKTAVDFTPVFFTSMEVARKHFMDYSSWHLWFVLVLLVFYSFYAGYDLIKEKFNLKYASKDNKSASVFKSLFITMIFMTVFFAVINLFVRDWLWGKAGFVIFQPTRVPVYIGIFSLGIYAASKNWFIEHTFPGNKWAWGAFFLFLSIALIACMSYIFQTWEQTHSAYFSLVHGLVRAGVVISSLGFLFSLVQGWAGKSSVIDSMSGYSYEIYIIHLPLVIAFAGLFTLIKIPLILKFFCVGISVIISSWALGRYLVKPYPKTACAVIASVFIILCFVYR